MALYKLMPLSGILNTETGDSFASDVRNRHYQEYMAWLKAGGTPDPADVPTKPKDEMAALISAVADRLNITPAVLNAEVKAKE